MRETILIADDEQGARDNLAAALRAGGYDVREAGDGPGVIRAIEAGQFAVAIVDLSLPGADGIAVLKNVRVIAPNTLVLVTTAHPTLETAVEALRHGAADYIVKPIQFADLIPEVGRLLECRGLLLQPALHAEVEAQYEVAELVGQSPAVRDAIELIGKVALTRSPVLITGESGTGKGVVARAIHRAGAGAPQGFFPLNCTGIPEALLETRLFGQAGAVKTRGLFALAPRGTIFLDDIGDMPFGLQAKLLRTIETKEIFPVGTTKATPVDARIIAASRRDLGRMIEVGSFNGDLYYRLNVVHIRLPPLRERREDIPGLVDYLVRHHNVEMKRTYRGADDAAMKILIEYPWHGNVRQLENAIEHAMIMGDGERITVADLPSSLHATDDGLPPVGDGLQGALRTYERLHIDGVLRRSGYNKREAAARLGMSLSSLYRKLNELGMDRGCGPDSVALARHSSPGVR